MKLSELKALLKDPAVANLDLDTIVDDSTGKTLGDLRKELGVNQSGFTKKSQEAAALAQQLSERDTKLSEVSSVAQQYYTHAQNLQTELAALKNPSSNGGVTWKDDPIVSAAVAELQKELSQTRGAIGQLIEANKNLATMYVNDRKEYVTRENNREVARLKTLYPDFDRDKVLAAAQKYGINDWEAAYNADRGARIEEITAERVKTARDEGMQLARDRGEAPATEQGAGNAPVREIAGDGPKTWDDAWGRSGPLADALNTLG